jgi:hypothetical protein
MMIPVLQKFPRSPRLDLAQSLGRDFVPKVKPGARIAVAVGSRGISNLSAVVAEVIGILRRAGAQPFIVPAMGSHGGATPAGQREILEGYGCSEKAMGVPIRDSMEVEELGTTEEGIRVFFSVEALRSDGIVAVNRVKPHTDFSGKVGSGIQKMLAVGLGKQKGAASYHGAASRLGLERVIRSVGRFNLQATPILYGIALIEDGFHETARVVVLPRDEIAVREDALTEEARRLMPRLPFEEIDFLIVDEFGKNITGAGMDPNVIGRSVHGYSSALSDRSTKPKVHRLFVRDLTPESHGNAIGIGLADFTTSRVVRAIDPKSSYMNALTALSLLSVKIPITFDTDREAIARGLGTLALEDPSTARVVRIKSTLALEKLEVSESLAPLMNGRADLEPLRGPEEMKFDPGNNLLPIGA